MMVARKTNILGGRYDGTIVDGSEGDVVQGCCLLTDFRSCCLWAICVPFVRQRLRRQDVPIISLSVAIVIFVAVRDICKKKNDYVGQEREQCEVCVPMKTFRPSYQLGKYDLQEWKMHIWCVNPLLLQFGGKRNPHQSLHDQQNAGKLLHLLR